MANQKRFNLEMAAYIKERRRKQQELGEQAFRIRVKPRAEEDLDLEELEEGGVKLEYAKPGFLRRLFSFKRRQVIESEELSEEERRKLLELEGEIEGIEEEMEELEETEEELEEEREGLLEKLRAFLGFKTREEEFDEDLEEEVLRASKSLVDEEVKEVLKITHSWLEKLSPKQKKAFKESEDFQRYKEFLVKYGLAKEKE